MSHTIAAMALLAAGAFLSARAPQPAPQPTPLRPEQREATSEMAAMSADKRVKADAIDTVMAGENVLFLDVREASEIEEHGSYEGYVHIPLGELEKRMGELPRDKTILAA